MISKAYIHEYGNNKMEPEHLDVKETLEARGIECEFFTTKRLMRNQLLIDDTTIVVGDNPTMMNVFKRLGINWTNDSYPESLRKYLNRNVWESSIRKLFMKSHENEVGNVFVKPKSSPKLFTGFVINSNLDLYRLDGIAKDTDLYCSSVVKWLSEYRVFVNKSKIVGIKNYHGDESLKLNMKVVENAIGDFEKSEQRTNAYGIDFGILDDGSTALIEWNDGFALGSYGLDKEVYTDLILTRWNEILKKTNV
ncbi:ATP-grasp domain-containing protein [Fluviicola sp.]|uniref:ATP-grasp domain-containing protein n=1 Tax=Fluviicola sp. TaxID=1917219 RepID=UPI0031D8CF7D